MLAGVRGGVLRVPQERGVRHSADGHRRWHRRRESLLLRRPGRPAHSECAGEKCAAGRVSDYALPWARRQQDELWRPGPTDRLQL